LPPEASFQTGSKAAALCFADDAFDGNSPMPCHPALLTRCC
jgi:hypothetical protein